jgi:hypothetical protein
MHRDEVGLHHGEPNNEANSDNRRKQEADSLSELPLVIYHRIIIPEIELPVPE